MSKRKLIKEHHTSRAQVFNIGKGKKRMRNNQSSGIKPGKLVIFSSRSWIKPINKLVYALSY